MLALLGLVPVANLLTARHVPWWTGAVLIWSAYGALLLAILWAVSDRWGAALDAALERAAARILRVPRRRFVAAVSAWTVAAAAFVAIYCFSGRGFTGDEMATAWHARMLLAGHLAIPAPAHPEFFETAATVVRGPRWYSQYPIGAPMLLSIGLVLGAPWIVNPLLLGVAAWQLHRFVRRAFGEPLARASVLLFALTPFVLVLGATQMSHAASLALTLTALAELAAWDQTASAGTAPRADVRRRIVRAATLHAAALGLAVGAIALVRPLDAVLVALPVGAFQLFRLRRAPALAPTLAIQLLAGLVPIALLLAANARTTGNPLLFAYDVANGPAHRWGFHVDPNGELHTPRRALVYASGYLMRLDRFLFEWPLPGLLVVAAVWLRLRRATRWDSLLLALAAVFVAGYAGYWYDGFFDGPRFLFPIVPVFVIYAARMPEAFASARNDGVRRVARIIVPVCVACAWLLPLGFTSVPGRLAALREQRTKLKTDVVAQARAADIHDAVVFVPESWRGRLLARLRALGLGQFEAERTLNTVDACALQIALDAEQATPASDDAALGRVLGRARMAGAAALQPARVAEDRVARAPGAPDAARCHEEHDADTLGTMPYAMFLREQTVTRDGRLDGAVIYARDLGARDTLLRAEYGARAWYRYRPARELGGAAQFDPMRLP